MMPKRDPSGAYFQDAFTENRGAGNAEKEDGAEHLHLDPNVDSQADDEAMEKDVFGVNAPQR